MRLIRHRESSYIVAGLTLLAALAGASLVYASSGTISSPEQYAWGNVAGWINFAPIDSPVAVSSKGLSGYVWSENDGWINLSPTEGGVTNNGEGSLGGWAWDQSAGWVSFTGVTIDSSGTFHGEATGADGYAINFNCSACGVRTSWRPVTSSGAVAALSSPGAISPVIVPNSAASSAPLPPEPPPSKGVLGAHPSATPGAAGHGGVAISQATATSSLVSSQPNIRSVAPRNVDDSSNSGAKTTSARFGSFFRHIVPPALAVVLLAVLAMALRTFL